ncbi:MAG: hypothetical protein ACLFPD_11365 [Desulfosudaceae bacterium]
MQRNADIGRLTKSSCSLRLFEVIYINGNGRSQDHHPLGRGQPVIFKFHPKESTREKASWNRPDHFLVIRATWRPPSETQKGPGFEDRFLDVEGAITGVSRQAATAAPEAAGSGSGVGRASWIFCFNLQSCSFRASLSTMGAFFHMND